MNPILIMISKIFFLLLYKMINISVVKLLCYHKFRIKVNTPRCCMSGKVLICVPTYNEAGNIASLIKNIFKYLDSCHILVIDDNSPDGTGSLVKNHPRFCSLFLLERDEKNGLGAAY